MPRSLARGDYSLIIAIESSSRPNSWYRVLADRHGGALSCDCPPWVFNHDERTCQHTNFATSLTSGTPAIHSGAVQVSATSSLLSATQQQWPGLRGEWQLQEMDTRINRQPYRVVLLRLALGNGGVATGSVAFAARHHHSEAEMVAGVAGWAGYAIAAEVARLGGFPLVGQPPDHFKVDRRPRRGTADQIPGIGLADILRVGDIVQPGTNPALVAENTLRLFLGEETYALLERQGFLDVSSVRYADHKRVYRLRRDPKHVRERRVRVMEHGRYVADYCRVLAQSAPEPDFYLTSFLQFLSDEEDALSVVKSHNIFPPYSDGTERETIPAVWRPRTLPLRFVLSSGQACFKMMPLP